MAFKYSKATVRAVRAYGLSTCVEAYLYSKQGYGASSIALECVSGLKTTRQADAAINAGEEFVTKTPVGFNALAGCPRIA